MRVLFLSELIDEKKLQVHMTRISQIFDDGQSEIIAVLSDTQFKIIEGKCQVVLIASDSGRKSEQREDQNQFHEGALQVVL